MRRLMMLPLVFLAFGLVGCPLDEISDYDSTISAGTNYILKQNNQTLNVGLNQFTPDIEVLPYSNPGAGWSIHTGAAQNRTHPVGFGGAHGVCYFSRSSGTANGFFSADTRLASFDNVTGKAYATTITTPDAGGGYGWCLGAGGDNPADVWNWVYFPTTDLVDGQHISYSDNLLVMTASAGQWSFMVCDKQAIIAGSTTVPGGCVGGPACVTLPAPLPSEVPVFGHNGTGAAAYLLGLDASNQLQLVTVGTDMAHLPMTVQPVGFGDMSAILAAPHTITKISTGTLPTFSGLGEVALDRINNVLWLSFMAACPGNTHTCVGVMKIIFVNVGGSLVPFRNALVWFDSSGSGVDNYLPALTVTSANGYPIATFTSSSATMPISEVAGDVDPATMTVSMHVDNPGTYNVGNSLPERVDFSGIDTVGVSDQTVGLGLYVKARTDGTGFNDPYDGIIAPNPGQL